IVGPLIGALLVPASFGSLLALYWQNIVEYLPLAGGISLLIVLLSDPDGLVSLNIKAAKAEVESKVAYLRPEVLILTGVAKGRQWASGRVPALRPRERAASPAAGRPAVVVRVPPKTLRVEELTV